MYVIQITLPCGHTVYHTVNQRLAIIPGTELVDVAKTVTDVPCPSCPR